MNNYINYRASFNATPDTVRSNINMARSAYASSNDSAALSASTIYLVWLDTFSSQAHADLAEWMRNEFAEINKKIDAHNEAEKALKTRVRKFASGSLDTTDPLMVKAKTADEHATQDKDRADLVTLQNLPDAAWTKRRMIRIEPRDNASEFAELVRFTLALYSPADASIVSRYSKVLEWIKAKFVGSAIADVSEIADAIKDAGGFERVINDQRGKEEGDPDEKNEKDEKAIAGAISELSVAAIMTGEAKGSFDLTANDLNEGIVTLLGRYKGGKVEIVAEAAVSADELNRTVSKFETALNLPTSAMTELVAHVIAIGDLVTIGETTNKREADLKSGATLLSERALTLMPSDKGTAIVVSARYAEASVVVKATPANASLGITPTAVMLAGKDLDKLASMVETRSRRTLIDISPVASGTDLAWSVSNSALVTAKSANAVRSFAFADLANIGHRPLDVTLFREHATATLSVDQLDTLRTDVFDDNKPSSKEAGKPIEFVFTTDKLAVRGNAKLVHVIDVPTSAPGIETLSVGAGDLFALLKLLSALKPASIDIAADTGGLLKFSWSDELASYEVYVPTAMSDGKLNPRRVEPMSPTAISSIAA